MQVSGGSQSSNAVNQMRMLGRWIRMIVVDVIEELGKFTLLTRDASGYNIHRYSDRKEAHAALDADLNLAQLQ